MLNKKIYSVENKKTVAWCNGSMNKIANLSPSKVVDYTNRRITGRLYFRFDFISKYSDMSNLKINFLIYYNNHN